MADTTKRRIPHGQALPRARQILEALAPAFTRIEIAGSLRRSAQAVGDIEFVAEYRMAEVGNLLDEPLPDWDLLARTLADLEARGLLAYDAGVRRDGPRYKRFVTVLLDRPNPLLMPVDLFLCPGPDNWGNTLAIRTGDGDFSRLLVTHRFKGGLMPDHMRQADGCLFARAQGYPDFREAPDVNEYPENRLSCPSEGEFFRHLGLDVPAMSVRHRQGAVWLRRESKKGAARV